VRGRRSEKRARSHQTKHFAAWSKRVAFTSYAKVVVKGHTHRIQHKVLSAWADVVSRHLQFSTSMEAAGSIVCSTKVRFENSTDTNGNIIHQGRDIDGTQHHSSLGGEEAHFDCVTLLVCAMNRRGGTWRA
jgi:hypothetical protein